jgi:hypothetical protein
MQFWTQLDADLTPECPVGRESGWPGFYGKNWGSASLIRARKAVSTYRSVWPYRMIHAECTVGELRELIAVPPHIERVLRAYAKAHIEDAHWIEACLKFRKAVAEEFERLLCAGAEGIDLPEVDDGELDPAEQGSAAA